MQRKAFLMVRELDDRKRKAQVQIEKKKELGLLGNEPPVPQEPVECVPAEEKARKILEIRRNRGQPVEALRPESPVVKKPKNRLFAQIGNLSSRTSVPTKTEGSKKLHDKLIMLSKSLNRFN